MSPINSSTVVVQFFDGVEVTSYRGEDDNAKVIQIDTQHDEHIRINLNDAPVFDGSPERNGPLGITKVERDDVVVTLGQLKVLAENAYVDARSHHDWHWTQLPPNTRLRRINDVRRQLERAGVVVEREPS